jgi:hypothetical protein
VNSNLADAVATARGAATDNDHLSTKFTAAQVSKVEVGQYLYDPSSTQFRVSAWTDVTTDTSATPPTGSWTALRVTLAVSQPTYFMRVFGVNTMPSGAVATAVYRPRDVAFALDMTGSMAYASLFNVNGNSHNPDTAVPSFGHYGNIQGNLVAGADVTNLFGEVYSRNNYTIKTRAGDPIVECFYSDPANFSNPGNVAFPVNVGGLVKAFRANLPASGGDPANCVPPTYDFSSYNAFDTTRANGPTPAPDSFKTMTGTNYVGDPWRRADGSINRTDTTWAAASPATRPASTAIELLGYNTAGPNVRGGTGTGVITTEDKFRDPVWERHGYDLDIARYRADKLNGDPMDPNTYTAPLLPAADRFKGYSMGPGYWGKTFFIWPPDPRTPVGNPGDGTYQPGDWRRRYFTQAGGGALDPQADNMAAAGFDGINKALLNTSRADGLTLNPVTGNWGVNYAAVLKWVKSGPQTLPPNLRAGRVLYYSSIPDDVNTSTGSTQERLDKVFWMKYIDYVFGRGYNASNFLYGRGDSWAAAPWSVFTSDLNTWTGPTGTWPADRPYMRYADSPNRPRLHSWFGPLSMMDFIAASTTVTRLDSTTAVKGNWLPGTCTEAQCWQLKAGMNSVLDDVRNNHPNDYAGLVMFSTAHNGVRVPMGQNYTALKNALFYPKSLLPAINGGDTTTEVRPYDNNFSPVTTDEIPNATGDTDPNTGLAYSFNLLAPSSLLPAEYLSYTNSVPPQPIQGRRGASKMIIFETDGVPNVYRGLSSGAHAMNPTTRGYETYYPTSAWSSGNVGNGNATSMDEAYRVTQQIVRQMATTNSAGTDSGLSLPNAPARVYTVAFGDLFDETLAPGATFRDTAKQFLANVSAYGNTGRAGATTIPDYQIITGPSDQRVTRIRDCMQRIFQSGVAVTLVE